MTLAVRHIGIDMGHRVTNHETKCKNLHGHRYEIYVGADDKLIKTEGAPDEGMVMDFGCIKQYMMEEIDEKFDHGFCMWEKDFFVPVFKLFKAGERIIGLINMNYEPQKIIFVPFVPTAENLAKHWYEVIKVRLLEKGVKLKYVEVWETPNCFVRYTDEDELKDENKE